MPLFDYHCNKCDKFEELLISNRIFVQSPNIKFFCKDCGNELHKQLGKVNQINIINGTPKFHN